MAETPPMSEFMTDRKNRESIINKQTFLTTADLPKILNQRLQSVVL